MPSVVLLDAGPLAALVHRSPVVSRPLWVWVESWVAAHGPGGLIVPEISDYEVRRKLLHLGSLRSLDRLDRLARWATYMPITTAVMRRAAELWAEARRTGRPNAAEAALDADVILTASAQLLLDAGHRVVVATTNPRHLDRFVDARLWSEIAPA